jgi:hypothetical protein
MYDITHTATSLDYDLNGKRLFFWETTEEADAVLIKPSNGNRCVYSYPTTATSGQYLTPGNNKTIGDVKICSDGRTGIAEPVVAEDPILPTTTAGVDCTGSISGLTLEEGSLVLAESLDGQTKAACSSSVGTGQAYCEDRCVSPRDVGETLACTQSVNANGEYNLAACKPCDTALDLMTDGDDSTNPPLHPIDRTPMEFCWEKTNSAYESTGDLAGTPPDLDGGAAADIPRTPGTMLKHTPIRQSENSTTWFNDCYTTSVPVNGRYYWVTTCR